MSVLISIDNGGTLTDACAVNNGELFHAKSLTTPYDLTKCFLDVLGKLSHQIYGEDTLHRLLAETDYIRYSTTQGTNSVVERKGPKLGLLLAKNADIASFSASPNERDLFEVMVGDRYVLIDTSLDDAALDEAVTKATNQLVQAGAARLVVSLTGANLIADEHRVREVLNHRFPRHLLGAVPYLLSSELSDHTDDHRRTWSAMINSFLHPSIDTFLYGAEAALKERKLHKPLLIYRNDDNSTRVAKTIALRTYNSGPRGGLAGSETLLKHYGLDNAVMMDIGGTSTDLAEVSSKVGTEPLLGDVEGIPVAVGMRGIHSLGAGGGSIMRVKDGKITVGPDSVGAAPGPACFGQGGKEATVTDAYLITGTFDPASYLKGTLQLDRERARAAIQRSIADPLKLSVEEAAFAAIEAYKKKIAEGIGEHTGKKSRSLLVAFGGGGPISACGVAEVAGFDKVLVPRMAAVFSAFGIGFSDIAHSYEVLVKADQLAVEAAFSELYERAERDMFSEGFDIADCNIRRGVLLVNGAAGEEVELGKDMKLPKAAKGAKTLRARLSVSRPIPKFALKKDGKGKGKAAKADGTRQLLQPDGSSVDAPVYRMERLSEGDHGTGPALIEDDYFTFRLLKGWSFRINANGDILAQKN